MTQMTQMTQPSASIALDLLERSREGLLDACHATAPSTRYLHAQLAALRAAAALVAARSVPDHRSGPRNVWELVPSVAPELTEWATFFAVPTDRRRHIERGQDLVSARAADDLLRQAETFAALVAAVLGLPAPQASADLLSPLLWS